MAILVKYNKQPIQKCRVCGLHRVYKDGLCTLCYYTDYKRPKVIFDKFKRDKND